MLVPSASCCTPVDPDADPYGVQLVDGDVADVWSLGITLLGCRVGVHPWDAARPTDPRYQVWANTWASLACGHGGGRDISTRTAVALGRALVAWCGVAVGEVERGWSLDLLDLVARMLDPEPATRLGMAEVVAHRWMGGLCETEVEVEVEVVGGAMGAGDAVVQGVSCVGCCSPSAVSAPQACLGVVEGSAVARCV